MTFQPFTIANPLLEVTFDLIGNYWYSIAITIATRALLLENP